MSLVTHMNQSCQTSECVTWHISVLLHCHVPLLKCTCACESKCACHMWISKGAHIDESRHTYEWVLPHVRMSHVTHINELCYTNEWMTWHISALLHTHEWVLPHIWMNRVTHISAAALPRARGNTSARARLRCRLLRSWWSRTGFMCCSVWQCVAVFGSVL